MQASIIKTFVPPQGTTSQLESISKQFNRQVKKWNKGGKHHG